MSPSVPAAVTAVFLLSIGFSASGQPPLHSAARSHSPVWQDTTEKAITDAITAKGKRPRRDIVPRFYRTLKLDKAALRGLLASAPPESSGPIGISGAEIELPLPSGGFGRFLVQESPVMEPKLAARFPELKTYVGQSVDDPSTTIRLDLTPRGFHAIVLSPTGQIYIDPYSRDTDTNYIAYFKRDFTTADKGFSCLVESPQVQQQTAPSSPTLARPTGANLRTYRLALSCTGEYAAAVCSPSAATVAGALAAMITSVNRCSAVYERELSIRFVLVNNTDKLIYLDGNSDPFTNNSPSALISQNQTNTDNIIGTANYDIGHVFGTGGGGLAAVGVVCFAGQKARGETGTSNPTGDPYDIDYVAHEMGHQFGANHSFNGTAGACAGTNRYGPTAYEPGSGTTIMAYAGICSPQDLAAHSDDYFHTISYDEIDLYTSNTGGTCAQLVATGNSPPTINALSSRTIPIQTPFALTANVTDTNGDALTYCWEEFDLGPGQDPTANPRDNGSAPIFRSLPPTPNPTRTFPALNWILNNANVPPAMWGAYATAEFLPITGRTMNFRVTVRDNHPGGGGLNYTSMTVTSTTTAGPFVVTSPNMAATFAAGSQITVGWNVANTTAAPVNCANVKISLSTDGGYTFPIVLANSVPNNGSALVTIPNTANVATTQGRIKVEAVGNIFFDISDANLTITSTQTAPTLNITGGITVARGKPTPTVATVGTASDAQGDPLTVSVSNVGAGIHVTPSISNGSISLSATVDCPVMTTLASRSYPMTLTVMDSNGSTTSGTVLLYAQPNPSPTLGAYPDISLAQNSSAISTPVATAADSNGNLIANPYSVFPTTLPGGGTLTINQSTGIVTAMTTALSSLVTTSVRVTVLDSCGAAAVRIFNVSVVASTTPLLLAGAAPEPAAESCGPINGAVDPGETVTINFPINNTGSGGTTNLVATLQSSGGVTPITANQTYGVIAPNSSLSKPFQFTANGTCGGMITATLQLQDGGTNYGTVSYTMTLGVLSTTFSENFDGITPPALPSGWSAIVASGAMTPWATNSVSPDSAPNSVSASTVPTVSDNRLTSPALSVPGSSPQLSFKHRWLLEDGFDGGILEISINGGPFVEITAAGGSFVSGPYTGTISAGYSSPIGGQSAWTGDSGGYTTTVVNLPGNSAGQQAQFRWRLACDSSVSDNNAVWRVDSIVLSSPAYVCSSCGAAPAITNGPPPSPVVVGSFYSFTFMATGNPPPIFSVKSGTLPPGITLSSVGVLSGTPTSAGNGNFPNITIAASNGNLPEAQQTFSLAAVTRVTSYINGYGLSGSNAGPMVDYDGDNIVNLEEYAFGLDPTHASISGLPVVTIKKYTGNKNYLSMTFDRSSVATDLTYTVQVSSDLVSWTDLASSVGGNPTTGPGLVLETGTAPNFTVEVRDTVLASSVPDGKRFMRLKITSQ